jgi:hypothetical protein
LASIAPFAMTACGASGGDAARFDIAGTVVSITESGTETVHSEHVPAVACVGSRTMASSESWSRLTARCPQPRSRQLPRRPPQSRQACALLTRALALQTLGPPIGRAQRINDGPDTTTYTYHKAKALALVPVQVLDAPTLETAPARQSPLQPTTVYWSSTISYLSLSQTPF